ncbi:hypothetical protein Tco_0618757 [Tanacetum coccineum]
MTTTTAGGWGEEGLSGEGAERDRIVVANSGRHRLPNAEGRRKCLKIVTFEATIDSEIMEKKSVITRLDKVSSPDRVYLVIYRANGNFRAFNYLMSGYFIYFDSKIYLIIMMESSTEENDQSDFWSNQQDWKIITWRLYKACGVCILELEDGIVIHILMKNDVCEWELEKGSDVLAKSTS